MNPKFWFSVASRNFITIRRGFGLECWMLWKVSKGTAENLIANEELRTESQRTQREYRVQRITYSLRFLRLWWVWTKWVNWENRHLNATRNQIEEMQIQSDAASFFRVVHISQWRIHSQTIRLCEEGTKGRKQCEWIIQEIRKKNLRVYRIHITKLFY